MVTRRLSTSISKQGAPSTQMRTATVIDVIEPQLTEDDTLTGWSVLLDFGGGEITNAGVGGTYQPIPGDIVAVMKYQGTLFVVDKVVAGVEGLEPGGRVGYAYHNAIAAGVFATAAISTEILVPDLAVPFTAMAGACYQVEIGMIGFQSNAADNWVNFRLRQNTVTGEDLGDFFRQPTSQANNICGFGQRRLIRNDTGVDFPVTAVLTITASSAGNASVWANTVTRPFMEITVKGSSKLYPSAAPMTAPPD
jgi:hypothetical protein